jgi:tRNA (mo5U34)-methyltransferase
MTLLTDVSSLNWYHTIDLPGGVTTAGYFDTRVAVEKMWFPESLAGKRCLDVGTCDGFWAFEMEKRGAADVVGIDVDDPTLRDLPAFVTSTHEDRAGQTFALAKQALDSSVTRVPINVYDLSPEHVGKFDFAFVGAILLHLRDPIRALTAVRSVTDELLIGDVIWLTGTKLFRGRPVAMLHGMGISTWWTANLAGLRRMCTAAGFDVISSGGPFYVPFGDGHPPRRKGKRSVVRAVSSTLIDRVGVPHGWVHARARTS